MALQPIEQELYDKIAGVTDQAIVSGAITDARNKFNQEYAWMRDAINKYSDLFTVRKLGEGGTVDIGNGYKIQYSEYHPNKYYGYDKITLLGSDGNEITSTVVYPNSSNTDRVNTLMGAFAKSLGYNPYISQTNLSTFNIAEDYANYLGATQPLEAHNPASGQTYTNEERDQIVAEGNAKFTEETGGFQGTNYADTVTPTFQVYDPATGQTYTGAAANDFLSGGSTAAPTGGEIVQVKTVNGDTISVYKDSIPQLIQEGTLPPNTTAPGLPDFGVSQVPLNSQQTNAPATKLPTGCLVINNDDGTIWFIDKNPDGTIVKRKITNMDTLNALPADKKYWFSVDSTHLDMATGVPITELDPKAVKPKTEVESLVTATSINWAEPRGYQTPGSTTGSTGPADTTGSTGSSGTTGTSGTTGASGTQATLTSPDGLYKTVVNVGSMEASQLLANGWKIGDSGKGIMDVNDAINYEVPETPGSETPGSETPGAETPEGEVPVVPEQTPGEAAAGAMSAYGTKRLDASQEPGAYEDTIKFLGTALTEAMRKGDISQATWDAAMNNPEQLRKYATALLYGGYSTIDIYRDMKAKELAAQGNSAYANFKAFDESIPADQWYTTAEGIKSKSDTSLTPPEGILNVDWTLLDNPIFDVPNNVFSELVPTIDWDSPEFKEEAKEIQAAWYDIMMQMSEAETEQQKALASSNWKIFQENLEKRYGIQLSDNARQAWTQLQDMFSGFTSRGLGQSGLYNEASDRYLTDVRRNDDRLREGMTDEKTLEERNYLLQSGTPSEIAAFIAANPDKAKEYGLVPSDENREWFSMENLKKVYPDLTDEQIQMIHDTVLDENGNYRSALYQNLYSNKYNLSEQKTTYQQNKLLEQKKLEEERAYAPWTTTNPFSSYNPSYITDALDKIGEKVTTPTTTPAGVSPSNSDYWSVNPDNLLGNNTTSSSSTLTPLQQLSIGAANGTITNQNQVNNLSSSGSNTDTSWNSFNIANKNLYQPISSSTQTSNYWNPQNPGGTTMYGIPYSSLTKISDPAQLTKYKEDQIIRQPGTSSIYLKPGISLT